MSPTVRIVAADPSRADRYAVALAGVERRHAAEWTPAAIHEAVDVVLFDPDTVAPSMVESERETRERPYRAVRMDGDVEATARRVERAAAQRRFERAIDERFDSLSIPSSRRPTVPVPESLGSAAFRGLYEAL